MENPLAALDRQAIRGSFPQLDNGYIYLAGANLSAFGDGTKWAIMFEIIGFHYKYYSEEGFRNSIHLFGNAIPPPHAGAKIYNYQCVTSSNISVLLEDGAMVNPTVQEILIGTPPNRFPTNLADFTAIALSADQGNMSPADLLRILVNHAREKLFISSEWLDNVWPFRPPLLLSLRDWRHPDVKLGMLPSETATFTMLSEVLRTGDSSLYDSSREKPNSHWSNWPLSGSL